MRRPPRLVVRTLAVTFGTVAIILAVVFTVLMVEAHDRVRSVEVQKLSLAERIFTTLEARREQEQLATIATVAENPTLKASLDTFFTESAFSNVASSQESSLRATVTREVEKLATLTGVQVLALLDAKGRVFVSAGPLRERWPTGTPILTPSDRLEAFQGIASLEGGPFQYLGAPIRLADLDVGALVIGTSLDADFASGLATLAHAEVVITVDDTVVASTLPAVIATGLVNDPRLRGGKIAPANPGGTYALNGEEYAIWTLPAPSPARIYTMTSIDTATSAAMGEAMAALGIIALGAFSLAGLGSFWLAHALTRPIDRLAAEIGVITASRDFRRPLHPTGVSLELDSLTETFNELVRGLRMAEADTESAYLGSIRAFAALLDARDPYTAGHSERVSAVSVSIGRQLGLGDADLEVLRLGALLHDIGKIGLSDAILRKPAALTHEEYEQLKRHPSIGARILRQVPFLAPHIPIVELHHERPDGRGYPFGLRGDEIPLAARIAHVADAFDAITSARAYRPARTNEEAVAELLKHSGTDFDPVAVNALVSVLNTAAHPSAISRRAKIA